MELEIIKEKLEQVIEQVKWEVDRMVELSEGKNVKIPEGRYTQVISTRLKAILGNPIENPIMRYEEAEKYYYNSENGLANLQAKYCDILELQDYIVKKTTLPFVYDKYLILKILQITLNTYNLFVEDSYSSTSASDEDIRNLFADIDTMLLSDRNLSAENGTKNAKAVDTINKYKKTNGGFGIMPTNEKNNGGIREVIVITNEEAQKKLHNNFGFSKLLEEKTNKNAK